MLSLLILAVLLCKSSTNALQIVDNKRVHKYHLIRATLLQNPNFRRRYHPMTSSIAGRRSSSSSPLFNDISSSNNNSNSSDDVESSSLVAYINIATWARPLILFSLGYGVGTISAPGWQRQSKVMSNIGFTRLALIFFISRDIWRSTPNWLKPKITRYGKKVINILRIPFRKKNMIDESESDDDDDDDDIIVDDTDISDLSNFATKLQRVMNVAEQKLEIKEDFNVQASVLAYLQLLSQVEARRASSHDKIYRESGAAVSDDMLEGLDVFFELADLAYDEHKDGNIQQVLEHMGYHLVKHDMTDVPGYLGHYIAINSDSKTAIIGVKGTSNFGDLLTDMCASSEQYSLPNPFYEGGSTSLTCHEGVWISSSRLFDTLLPIVRDLLLPSDYRLVFSP